MTNIRLSQILCILVSLVLSISSAADEKPIKILLLTSEEKPVDVQIFLKKDGGAAGVAGAFTGGLGGLFVGLAIEKRNKGFAEELAGRLPAESDRITAFTQSMIEALSERAPKIEIRASENTSLLTNGKPNFEKLQTEGHRFVLILNPSLSYQTTNYWKDLVAPGISCRAALFDVNAKKKIWQRYLFAPGGPQAFWKDAIKDETPLVESIPYATPRFAIGLYSDMLRRDALHELARASGVEDLYPAIKPILKEEVKNFTLKRSIPKGWKKLPFPDKYIHIASEKGKEASLSIVTHIDLLRPELEQECQTVEEYLEIQKQLNPNLTATQVTLNEFDLSDLKQNWTAYSLEEAANQSLTLFRIEGQFMLKHSLIAESETPVPDLQRGLSDFISYVNETKFDRK